MVSTRDGNRASAPGDKEQMALTPGKAALATAVAVEVVVMPPGVGGISKFYEQP